MTLKKKKKEIFFYYNHLQNKKGYILLPEEGFLIWRDWRVRCFFFPNFLEIAVTWTKFYFILVKFMKIFSIVCDVCKYCTLILNSATCHKGLCSLRQGVVTVSNRWQYQVFIHFLSCIDVVQGSQSWPKTVSSSLFPLSSIFPIPTSTSWKVSLSLT